MTIISVELSDEMKAIVDRRIAEGGYKSPEEYVATLLNRDLEDVFVSTDELEAELLKGINDPVTPVTADDWAALNKKLDAYIVDRKAK